jgi:hypothetical protein
MPTSLSSVFSGLYLNFWSGCVCIMAVISSNRTLCLCTDFHDFCQNNGELIFSRAAPTTDLHETIENFDFTKHVDNFRLQPLVMYVIRRSVRFIMFAFLCYLNVFLEILRCGTAIPCSTGFICYVYPKENSTVFRRCTCPLRLGRGSCFGSSNVTIFATLRDIFDLSLEMVDDDRNSGFHLLSQPLDPYWCPAMNDLLEDPQGEFFIDDNQYADIALHMVKYMSADLSTSHLLDILTLLLMSHCRSYPLDKASDLPTWH